MTLSMPKNQPLAYGENVFTLLGMRGEKDFANLKTFSFSWRHLPVALLVLFVLLTAGCALLPRRNSIPSGEHVQQFKLSNGLTVYALESHAVPLVTLDMWVCVGSKDEPERLAGISHFLEHMMFKGTPRLGVGDYDRRIEELGGYLNAATSTDYTHYYLTVPSEHLESALEDMTDVMLNSLFDPVEFSRERSVILEEINQKQDNPVGFLFDEVTRSIYEQGPYANTVIGSAETVSAMDREDLVEHYKRFYAPDNMAFVVVGDFDTQRLQELLEDHFESLNRDRDPWREHAPETVFSTRQERSWKRDWQQTYFFFTFPGLAADDIEQVAAMDLAEQILFGGRSSRLVNVMREKKRLVTSISGFFQTNRYPGFLSIYGTTPFNNVEEVREALFEELEKLQKDGFRSEELRKAKRQIINEHLYQSETNTGKASMIGYSHALFGNGSLMEEYPSVVDDISEKQVREVLDLLVKDKASFFVAQPSEKLAARAAQ